MRKEVLSAGEHFLPALLHAATKEMAEEKEIIHVSNFSETSAAERWAQDPYTKHGGYVQNSVQNRIVQFPRVYLWSTRSLAARPPQLHYC